MTTQFNISDIVRTEQGEMATVQEIRTRGWITIKTAAGVTRNVQAKTLSAVEAEIEAEIDEPEAEDISTAPFDWTHCPKCGSTEIYNGRVVDGIVKDEGPNGIWGCHECDWEEDFHSTRKNGVVQSSYLDHYTRTTVTRDGNTIRSMDNGDSVAVALRQIDSMENLYSYAAAHLGVSEDDLLARYGHLNVGMQRMAIGNRLRAAARRATPKK